MSAFSCVLQLQVFSRHAAAGLDVSDFFKIFDIGLEPKYRHLHPHHQNSSNLFPELPEVTAAQARFATCTLPRRSTVLQYLLLYKGRRADNQLDQGNVCADNKIGLLVAAEQQGQ